MSKAFARLQKKSHSEYKSTSCRKGEIQSKTIKNISSCTKPLFLFSGLNLFYILWNFMLTKYLLRALKTDWKKMALVKKAAGIFLCISRQSSHSGWQPRGALGLDCRSSSCRSTEVHLNHPVVFKPHRSTTVLVHLDYQAPSKLYLHHLQAVLAPPPSPPAILSTC